MSAKIPPRVLSIQSHVAYGHVGNAAAILPLQLLKVQPVAVHTVQFSNHTGYGEFKGQVFSAEHIEEVLSGLRARGILATCQAILSGYLGDASTGEVILKTVDEIRQSNPNLVYLCDPVMGDMGRGVFVRPGIPDFLRKKAITEASIITPNQFEFELLTESSDTENQSLEDIITIARQLLAAPDSRLNTIIITSLRTIDLDQDKLYTLAITHREAYLVTTPYIPLEPLPNGMGDTFSAILLGHILNGQDIAQATSLAVSSLYELVAQTVAGQRDLPLISEQQQITHPRHIFPAIMC